MGSLLLILGIINIASATANAYFWSKTKSDFSFAMMVCASLAAFMAITIASIQ